eukprot:gene7054-14353_t
MISVIIVTSPSPYHPSIVLVENVINSCIQNLEPCSLELTKFIVVCDGYKISHTNRTKKGRITPQFAINYESYITSLQSKYDSSNFSFIKLKSRNGFAMAVKYGLENCVTDYAIILQHDRIFCKKFKHLNDLIRIFESNSSIRYIGFPTIKSISHANILQSKYSLEYLLSDEYCIDLNDTYSIQPLIFWYDSNHFCHVGRYLQIFKPWKYFPLTLKNICGIDFLKSLLLKNGDFIEDKFGQAQRNIFVKYAKDPSIIRQLHDWYGCYLLYSRSRSYVVRTCDVEVEVIQLNVSVLQIERDVDIQIEEYFNEGDNNTTSTNYNNNATTTTATDTDTITTTTFNSINNIENITDHEYIEKNEGDNNNVEVEVEVETDDSHYCHDQVFVRHIRDINNIDRKIQSRPIKATAVVHTEVFVAVLDDMILSTTSKIASMLIWAVDEQSTSMIPELPHGNLSNPYDDARLQAATTVPYSTASRPSTAHSNQLSRPNNHCPGRYVSPSRTNRTLNTS